MSLKTSRPWLAGAAVLLALLVLPLLVRDVAAIPAHVPLDPNEGWNGAHVMALLAGNKLYPPAQSLMVNNYPPLSFYLVAILAAHGGDVIVLGRWLSLAGFVLTVTGIAACLKILHCRAPSIALAILFFAAVLLVGSDYVGMYDPQLIGHALQMAGLFLVLRGHLGPAALLFVAGLFIKHNLMALPLAATLWLLRTDLGAGRRLLLWQLGLGLCGLILFRLAFQTSLLAQLASPRLYTGANLGEALTHLWWVVLPLAGLPGLARDREGLLCKLYAAIAAVLGLGFAAGDGVDSNGFFDLAIALALGLGLLADRGRRPFLAALSALPLVFAAAITFDDNNFAFTGGFAQTSARNIAFLKSRTGPALCDQLSLCLWAGKKAQVDVFNVGEEIETGARDPKALAAMIADRRFAVLQLQELEALGPVIRRAILRHYRLDHRDDNGAFLVPRR